MVCSIDGGCLENQLHVGCLESAVEPGLEGGGVGTENALAKCLRNGTKSLLEQTNQRAGLAFGEPSA